MKSLQKNNLGFLYNPFEEVFLSKCIEKQVQIVNPEFIVPENFIDANTMKWTIEYVINMINEDDSIDIKFADNNVTENELIGLLEQYSKNMKNYCQHHKLYYVEECRKCKLKREEIQKKYSYVYLKDIYALNSNKINEGGESTIYNHGKNHVIKIFKEDKIDMGFKIDIISKILDKAGKIKNINNRDENYQYIIPEQLIIDNNTKTIVGYKMKKVKGFPISDLKNKTRVKKLGFTRIDIIKILISIGKGIETLHNELNIFIGDLNGRNILFDENKKIYFLDFDGMGTDELVPEFYTDGYIDPVSKKNKKVTMKDDWYSFAIQAFYYLTYTHPFNGIDKKNLELVERMEAKKSLLGNHGIVPPKIAVPWNWMDIELQKAFLNIFEGNSRISIVPYLEKCLENLVDRNDDDEFNEEVIDEFENFSDDESEDDEVDEFIEGIYKEIMMKSQYMKNKELYKYNQNNYLQKDILDKKIDKFIKEFYEKR